MRLAQSLAVAVCVGLLSATCPLNPQRAAAAPTTDGNTSARIVIGSTTKALAADINATFPNIWYSSGFNDLKWGYPVPVSPAVTACVTEKMGSWEGFPAYWGTGNPVTLLVRQHFFMPKVGIQFGGYAGTTIDLRSYARDTEVWLNDSQVLAAYSQDFTEPSPGVQSRAASSTTDRIPVGNLVHAGDNVLAIRLNASTDMRTPAGATCNAISFIITTQAHSVIGNALPSPPPVPTSTAVPTLIPSGPTVLLASPPDNAYVTGSALPLSWQPFRHAAAYLVRIWLVKADAGRAVKAGTVATIAQTVPGLRTAIPTAGLLKGQYNWDVAALNAPGQLITVWSAPRRLQFE